MRYLVQERIFSLRADFWIEDEDGNRVFLVDGRALSLRETFELKDAYGNLLILIRKKIFSMRDTMEIENGQGVVATVRNPSAAPVLAGLAVRPARRPAWLAAAAPAATG